MNGNNNYQDGQPSQGPAKRNKKNKRSIVKSGARVAKSVVSIALLLALGYGLHGANNELKDYKHISDLLKNYSEENACLLPSQAMTTACYDLKVSPGEKLVRTLKWHDIEYCRINGEYYTPNGIEIAVISLEVTRRDTKSSLAVDNSSGKVYAAPDGYTIVGEDCYKDAKEIITRVVPKSSNYDGIVATIGEEYTVSSIISIEELPSKTYAEIADKDLVCDVPDTAVPDENNNYPGTLKLVP